MRVSTRKALRDLRRQRAQVVAVAITIMLGVGLFIASAGAFDNLSGSYQRTYDRLHFGDLFATGGDPAAVARAATAAGADATAVRTQLDPPMLIDGTKLVGRVVGMPADAQPAVNAVEVTQGRYLSPDDPTGVLVETHAAETFGLVPGDTLQVYGAGRWQTVTVRGVAVSAEYIWPARSRQDVLSDPHSFAVVFAPESSLEAWSGTGPNQVSVLLPGGTGDPATGAVSAAMTAAGATDVTTQAEQPSPATLQLDLDGFQQMSLAFPALFLTAAAVAAYVLLARRVRSERPVIGTLMASGARRGRVVRHYLLQGLLVGLVGAVAGVVLGVLATGVVTQAYTTSLGIPDTVVTQHPWLAVVGLAAGLGIGVLGAVAPALTAARTAPAAAMRNESVVREPGWWGRAVSSMRALPTATRMALRDVTRSRRRTAATALGSVLALILVLASVGMMTSMLSALRLQYDDIERQDATVTVDPAQSAQVGTALRGTSGVETVEPSVIGPVTVSSGSATYSTALQGFVPATVMHGFLSTDGSWTALPAHGVLAGASMAEKLGIAAGDTVTVTTAAGTTARETVVGFVDEPLGTNLYATDDVASAALGPTAASTYLVRFAPGTDRDTMRTTISRLDGVVAYSDEQAFVSSLDQYLGLFWVFIGVMVALGGVLALAIVYVTMAVNVVERTNELATLRAAGVPMRRVGETLATENLVATLLGIPVGLLLGYVAADRFLGMFSSDLFVLRLDLGWWAMALAALGVLLAAAASLWPAVRAVRRLDVARVVRERAA